MTQPPYRSSEGNPMRRFAIFATVLTIIIFVGIGSQPRSVAAASKKSFCVCVASRAGLIMRSVKNSLAKTQAPPTQASTEMASAE